MSQATTWDVLARAAKQRDAEDETRLLEFVSFELAGDPYAIPVERVREIVRLRPITAVPRVPAEVRGVVSLRGDVVQLLDLRRRLGLPPAEPTRKTRIVVLHGGDSEVAALLVDRVSEVLRTTEDEICSPPSGETQFVSSLCRSEGGFVSLMNLDRVLDLDVD